jgi:hypothetical protein
MNLLDELMISTFSRFSSLSKIMKERRDQLNYKIKHIKNKEMKNYFAHKKN